MKLQLGVELVSWLRKLVHSKHTEDEVDGAIERRRSALDVPPPEYHLVAGKSDLAAAVLKIDQKQPEQPCLDNLLGDRHELTHVTPASLKSALNSTLKNRDMQTRDLVIRGEPNIIYAKPISAHKMKTLSKVCPSIRQLAIEEVNLCPNGRKRRVNLDDFPSTLCSLSIRDSITDVKLFMKTKHDFSNIRVLDLGRSINATAMDKVWPHMENLNELYLEGVQGLSSNEFFQTILLNCPVLRVLDLEGTDIRTETIELLAKFAPQIEKLYLGFTGLQDSSFHYLERYKVALRCLLTLCLADTQVTSFGLERLRKVAPNLRDVSVNGFTILQHDDEEDVFLPLRVHRVCNVHIGALFRNHGCQHFKLAHPSQTANQRRLNEGKN